MIEYVNDNKNLFFVVAIVVVVLLAIAFVYGYFNSFEKANMQVVSMNWRTTSELVHSEMDCQTSIDLQTRKPEIKCDTKTVVDERYIFDGANNDEIIYYQFSGFQSWQQTRYYFRSNVGLVINESESIIYHADQTTYENISLGIYCRGVIGWFNHVYNLSCSGR